MSPLRRATIVVNVAPTQADSGRFSALDADQLAVSPTLLDSLAEDLSVAPHTNHGDVRPIGVQSIRGAVADECSSVSSESCWGEMEDIDDEAVEWGVLHHPPSGLGGDSAGCREVNCVRENEAMGTVVDPTSVEFLDSQPVRPTTVDPDGPIPHQSTIPSGRQDSQGTVAATH